jgi:hypothetical protein
MLRRGLRDIVPGDRLGELGPARIVSTNSASSSARRSAREAHQGTGWPAPGRLHRGARRDGAPSDPAAGQTRNIVVRNDEAHHCYPAGSAPTTTSRPARAARTSAKRPSATRSTGVADGLQAVAAKTGARVVHDLSATPVYLRGGDAVPVVCVRLLADQRHSAGAGGDPARAGRRQRGSRPWCSQSRLRYRTNSRIRPRSRKPTRAYSRSAISVACRLAVRHPRSTASCSASTVTAVPSPRLRRLSSVTTL